MSDVAEIITTLLVDAQGSISLDFQYTKNGYIACVVRVGKRRKIRFVSTDIESLVKEVKTVLQQEGMAW